MADRKKGIDDETRRVLADLASRAGTRISGRQRARWEPGNVSNPQDRYLSGVFTDEAAWSLVAEKLRDGHEVETMVLDGDLEITVTLPVRQCADCDEEFLDYVGSRIKDEAVYHAHDLLSPWDIRGIRERRGLSRPAFAEVTGLGEATIKRWETGATAQNRGYDRYLRLLDTDLGWSILKKLARDQTSPGRPAATAGAERFPHVPQDQINSAQASTFRIAA